MRPDRAGRYNGPMRSRALVDTCQVAASAPDVLSRLPIHLAAARCTLTLSTATERTEWLAGWPVARRAARWQLGRRSGVAALDVVPLGARRAQLSLLLRVSPWRPLPPATAIALLDELRASVERPRQVAPPVAAKGSAAA